MINHENTNDTLNLARQAELNGDKNIALNYFEQVVNVRPNNVTARVSLARLLQKQGRLNAALDQWIEVSTRRPGNKSCWYELGVLYEKNKKYKQAIASYERHLIVVPGHRKSLQIIKELTRHLEYLNDKFEYEFKHIAIAGVSYSGSTLLASLLGRIPGVANAGETNWLVRHKEVESREAICFDHDVLSNIPSCLQCGIGCKTFDVSFRKNLQSNPLSWHHKIAKRLRCRVLVTADKNYTKLKLLDPALRFDSIVIFKSPMQAWYSNYRKMSSGHRLMKPMVDIDLYLDKWTKSYSKFLDNFPIEGKTVFLDFESFAKDPAFHIKKLCNIYSLEESSSEEMPSQQHTIGGNPQFNEETAHSKNTVVVRPLPAVHLPSKHTTRIEDHLESHLVHAKLKSLYLNSFDLPRS